jgi:catechol 2,3-dioxygenase-like lactoylglutathione lyase family enzyme
MAASGLINLSGLIDNAKCFAPVRQHRWPEGVGCPGCDKDAVIRDGHDDVQPCRQRYRCKTCSGRFDILLFSSGVLRSIEFYRHVLGLRLSDRSGDGVAFMHGIHGSDHHMIALAKPGAAGGLHRQPRTCPVAQPHWGCGHSGRRRQAGAPPVAGQGRTPMVTWLPGIGARTLYKQGAADCLPGQEFFPSK